MSYQNKSEAPNVINFSRVLKYHCFINNGFKVESVSFGIQYGSTPLTKTKQKQKIKV
jgi:hypothetical protein